MKCCIQESSSVKGKLIVVTEVSHICCLSAAVVKITAISVLNQLLVLSNEAVTVLNLETLDIVRKLKFRNVSSFCLNENPLLVDDPFTVEVCFGTLKKIHLVHLKDDQVKVVRDFNCSSTATLALAMDGVHVCFAAGYEYCMLDVVTGDVQQLFSRDSAQKSPVIHRTSRVNQNLSKLSMKLIQMLTNEMHFSTGGVFIEWSWRTGSICFYTGIFRETSHSISS